MPRPSAQVTGAGRLSEPDRHAASPHQADQLSDWIPDHPVTVGAKALLPEWVRRNAEQPDLPGHLIDRAVAAGRRRRQLLTLPAGRGLHAAGSAGVVGSRCSGILWLLRAGAAATAISSTEMSVTITAPARLEPADRQSLTRQARPTRPRASGSRRGQRKPWGSCRYPGSSAARRVREG